MSLTDSLKDHVVIVVGTIAIAAFGAGWQANKAVVEQADQVLILRTQKEDLERKAAELDRVNESLRRTASATPLGTDPAACRSQLATEIDALYLRKSDVERDYVLRSQIATRPGFDGQWRYLALRNATGLDVANRLTQIGPPQDAVVVAYDGSANNTFHVWYRGQGTGTQYAYTYAPTNQLVDPPPTNYFLSESGVIPAGIGGTGNDAVPIYFVAR